MAQNALQSTSPMRVSVLYRVKPDNRCGTGNPDRAAAGDRCQPAEPARMRVYSLERLAPQISEVVKDQPGHHTGVWCMSMK
jgi:hypothetical protein